MSPRILLALLAGAGLAGCAVQSPALRQNFSVRQVPYTPDSGSLAIRCGRLIDGVVVHARRDVLVVVRDGKITDVVDDAPTKLAALTHLPVLDLSAWTCLPGLIDMHTHLTDGPEDTADLVLRIAMSYFLIPNADRSDLLLALRAVVSVATGTPAPSTSEESA